MKYFFFSIIFCIFFPLSSYSEFVNRNQAQIVALNFLYEITGQKKSSVDIYTHHLLKKDTTSILHVFNLKNNKGFILISAYDILYPVIAYSYEGNFIPEKSNNAFNLWIYNYKYVIEYKRNKHLPYNNFSNTWKKYYTGDVTYIKNQKSVAPMLSTTWGQGCYYNYLCPADNKAANTCKKVPVGCVATAMAQVMKYWEHPVKGSGNKYDDTSYGTLYKNFSESYYDWDLMPDKLNKLSTISPVKEVANILLDCGIAVNMKYGTEASSSFAEDIPTAMKDYFHYSPSIDFRYREGTSQSDWINHLKTQIDNAKPLIYIAADESYGGHAFIFDGYQNEAFFHINWGWDGYLDGYYYLSELNPQGLDFKLWHGAVTNIYPSPVIDGPSHVNANQGDCSYNVSYYKAYNYEWSVTAGEIISGQNTENIKVNWNRNGPGKISVKVFFDNDKSVNRNITTSIDVAINPDSLHIYRLSANNLSLNLFSDINGLVKIKFYTMNGKKIYDYEIKKNIKNLMTNIPLNSNMQEIIFAEIIFNNKRLIKKIPFAL